MKYNTPVLELLSNATFTVNTNIVKHRDYYDYYNLKLKKGRYYKVEAGPSFCFCYKAGSFEVQNLVEPYSTQWLYCPPHSKNVWLYCIEVVECLHELIELELRLQED